MTDYTFTAVDPYKYLEVNEEAFVNKYGEAGQKFIEKIRADERAKVIAEVDGIDLLLAMIQSTTEDTPHSEMIEMVEKVRAELRAKLEEMKEGK